MDNNKTPLFDEILIVDDMPASLELLASILTEAGYIVRVANTGESALRSVQLKRPALILLDIKMPVIDGFEVCQRLKAESQFADIPIIFLSCLQEISDSIRGFELGAVDYITKPFHAQNILMRVKAQLALFKAKAQLTEQNIQLNQLNAHILQEISKREAVEETLRQHQTQLEELVTKRTLALSKANARYQALFTQARDGIVLINADNGKIINCNAEFERLTGRNLAQLQTLHAWDLRVAEQEALSKRIFTQIREQGYTECNESLFQRPDGSVLPVEFAAKVISFDHERTIQSIVRDISERKRIEAAKQLSEERFYNLFNSMHEGFYLAELIFDDSGQAVDWRFLESNPVHAKALGSRHEDIIGHTVMQLMPQLDDYWLKAPIQTALTGEPVHLEGFGKITQRYYSIHYYSPHYGQFACIFNDITERKLMENALRDSEARYARVIAGSDQGFWDWNLQNHQIKVSSRFKSILGYSDDEVSFATLEEWTNYIHPDDRVKTKIAAERHITSRIAKYDVEMRCLSKTKQWQWLLIRGQIVTWDENGKALMMSGTSTDISARKQAEAQIWRQANYDALTGLPNRNMFYDRLSQEIKKAQRKRGSFALLFVDLDKFKDVNDTLGHHQGDVLLKQVATRLHQCVRLSDTIARLGGDEFTIILPELENNAKGIERVVEAIIASLAEAFYLGNDIAFVSASVGITVYPNDSKQPDTLICNADQAMYAAKALGRNCFHYFTPELQAAAQRRMNLINDLHGALTEQQFYIYYQPIVDLSTGLALKAEALIRWQHPQHGLISPNEFIPLAEETGMIIRIGDWVFREAACQVKRLRETYHPQFQISVNKSPIQFRNDTVFFQQWLPYLQEIGLSPDGIVIEITEGLLLNTEANIIRKLLTFRDAGIQVALDDFGTGYSSLSYLREFDIDYLKIDQSFIKNLMPASNDLVLCEAIIVMAHKLGLKVIAEGVTTTAQQQLLVAAACDYGQGYLFSEPLTLDELNLFLQRSIIS